MPLDPNVKQLLDQMAAMDLPPMSSMSPADVRAGMEMTVAMMAIREDVASVEDRTIEVGGHALPVRIYRPEGLVEGPAPTLVFYHGGGFVIGSLQTHDGDCRALANRGECQVIAVDYRLAPEHPFPAAVDDAIAALEYVVTHPDELGVDVSRVAVGGDSAGGNLAAVTALHARDAGIDLKLQLLIYPAVAGVTDDYPSRTENANGYALDEDSVAFFMAAYAPDGLPEHWRGVPMAAASHAGVAPALVITAEFDPLRDEGEAYAVKLESSGVVAKSTRYDGMIHGFFGMGSIVPAAKAAVDEAGAALHDALH